MGELLAMIEVLPLAVALRGSVWAYPLVNAGHIVGISLLFGSIAVLDLRLIGFGRIVALPELARAAIPVAAAGLLIAVAAGALLFITDAADYAYSRLFRAKMVLLLLALANAVYFRRVATVGSTTRQRVAGIGSLLLWLAVIVLGRLVGYY